MQKMLDLPMTHAATDPRGFTASRRRALSSSAHMYTFNFQHDSFHSSYRPAQLRHVRPCTGSSCRGAESSLRTSAITATVPRHTNASSPVIFGVVHGLRKWIKDCCRPCQPFNDTPQRATQSFSSNTTFNHVSHCSHAGHRHLPGSTHTNRAIRGS